MVFWSHFLPQLSPTQLIKCSLFAGGEPLHLSGGFWSSAQGTVKSWTGLAMGVGIAPTKTLAKVHSGQQSNGHSFPVWSR